MLEEIKSNLDQPLKLEQLYRENQSAFKRVFNSLYPDIKDKVTAQVWNARLNFEGEEIFRGNYKELIFVLVASFIAGLIAKIPDLSGINPEYFFPRNIGFIVLPLLAAYFFWKHAVPMKNMLVASGIFLVSGVYINLLPNDTQSDTIILACIHLPLLLWAVLGFSFVGEKVKDKQKRIDFLRYNADLAVMTAVILIAGGILTAITFGLFQLIGISIQEIYANYIIVWALAACPIIGTYLVRTNQELVSKVAPVIARIFTPIVLVTLVIYLFAMVFTGKNPYNDREFLLVFNALLVGVMALILFSIAETSQQTQRKIGTILLLCLSVVTLIINGIALSAIVFRIVEWGMTPNRLAVLGGNILILINLFIVAYRLFKTVKDRHSLEKVENSIASFLPVYCLWTIFVIFILPLLFNFK